MGLVALVAVLALLQYRWLGEVSEAERARMQSSLRLRADEFAANFDTDLAHIYSSFQTDGAALLAGDARGFAKRFDAWRETTQQPGIVSHVYLFDETKPETLSLYDPDAHLFASTPWPAALDVVRNDYRQTKSVLLSGLYTTVISIARSPVVASVPALRIVLPFVRARIQRDGPGSLPLNFTNDGTAVLIVELDRDYLRSTVFPALADRYFSAHDIDSYRFAVIDRGDHSRTLFARGTDDGAALAAHADATADLFTLRDAAIKSLAKSDLGDVLFSTAALAAGRSFASRSSSSSPRPTSPAPPAPPTVGSAINYSQFGIVVEQQRAAGAGGDLVHTDVRTTAEPAWQLVLQHSSGSVDVAVTNARRRNLVVSFGMLALLAASVSLVIINAERSRRLATQQLEFVATVSHELRTPLAVIRSAAQNLSAGVIQDASQAKRYGELIDAEGRRLTDMVEQVLAFAGLSGNGRDLKTRPVDMTLLVRDIVNTHSAAFQAAGIVPEINVDEHVPMALVDESTMRQALENLIANALKHGGHGEWIGISVRGALARVVPRRRRSFGSTHGRGTEVQISVSDHGRGIDAEDMPHIFEPFYRGRYTIDRQIHGNGLGLSLVKRIVDAHGGRVSVHSTPDDGTTFTLHLPSAAVTAPDPSMDAISVPHPEAPAS